MRIYFTLIILLLKNSFVFSQITISGQIIDKQTNKPIPSVVIYTDNKNTITITDDNGNFSLEVNSSEQVYFRQLAYNFFSIISDSLMSNPKIYLNQHIIELNESIIYPDYARKLLEKSIQNLNARLRLNETFFYLFHVEGTTSIGGEKELYALIDATLSKINKKGEPSWGFNLILLDKIKEVNKEGFYIKNRPLWLELYPEKGVAPNLSQFIFEIQENNDYQIIIKASPKRPGKELHRYNLYIINKQDTVLTEFISQSLPDIVNITIQKFSGIYRQIISHYSTVEYAKDNTTNAYFYKGGQHIVKAKIYSDSPYYLTGKITDFMIGNLVSGGQEKKKIKPYDYILFEADFPNTPDFWKEYVNP